MKPCRYAGSDQPRMLKTHLRDCETSGCEGCEPCTERHCSTCGIRHVEALTCPSCVGDVREDLAKIAALSGHLLTEAVHRGVDSEAAMLAGPAADVEAWRNRWMSARQGRIPAYWLEDCRDEAHPLYVLGTWDMLVTEHYGHERTQRVTIDGAVVYLGANLTELAQDRDFAFEELAREVRQCRGHLEDVLHDGERDERSQAPCPMCGDAALVKVGGEQQKARCACGPRPTLKHAEHGRCTCSFRLRFERPDPEKDPVAVRVYDEPLEPGHIHPRDDLDCIACRRENDWDMLHGSHALDEDDLWMCPRRDCRATYTEHDYRAKVTAVYVLHADRLTASQIAVTYRVPEGTVRRWASGVAPTVRVHGRDDAGRQLYDVSDVLAMRDSSGIVSA